MHIVFNSKLIDIGEINKIPPLLDHLELCHSSFALALNGEHVLKTEYEKIELKEGARIDIFKPMVGG